MRLQRQESKVCPRTHIVLRQSQAWEQMQEKSVSMAREEKRWRVLVKIMWVGGLRTTRTTYFLAPLRLLYMRARILWWLRMDVIPWPGAAQISSTVHRQEWGPYLLHLPSEMKGDRHENYTSRQRIIHTSASWACEAMTSNFAAGWTTSTSRIIVAASEVTNSRPRWLMRSLFLPIESCFNGWNEKNGNGKTRH